MSAVLVLRAYVNPVLLANERNTGSAKSKQRHSQAEEKTSKLLQAKASVKSIIVVCTQNASVMV